MEFILGALPKAVLGEQVNLFGVPPNAETPQ